MPAGDGTGPWGFGPMTGRGAGFCAGYPVPRFAQGIPGRGWSGLGRGGWPWGRGRGRGFGMGRGWWRGYALYGSPYGYAPYAYTYGSPGYAPHYAPVSGYPSYSPTASQPGYGYSGYPQLTEEQELQMLREEATALKSEMEAIEARIKKLAKGK